MGPWCQESRPVKHNFLSSEHLTNGQHGAYSINLFTSVFDIDRARQDLTRTLAMRANIRLG